MKVVSLKPAPEIVRLRLDTINRSLEITGTRQADQVSIGKNSKGLLTLNINGKTHSADPADRGQFDIRLFGVRSDRLQTVKFTGGSSTDTLIINTSLGRNSAQVKIQTDDILRIDSGFTTNSNLSITTSSLIVTAPIQAGRISVTSTGLLNIEQTGSLIATSGVMDLKASRMVQTGKLYATGSSPIMKLQANVLIRSGTITAPGGSVTIPFTQNYVATESATIDVSGAGTSQAKGGFIQIDGGLAGHIFNSGRFIATGSETGGTVKVSGNELVWVGGGADASGGLKGGLVQIGGGWQGSDASMTKARSLEISPYTTIQSNGSVQGGTVVLWSEESTTNLANLRATGTKGGSVEVSSKLHLAHAGSVDAGPGGRVLIDPKNINIVENPNGSLPMFELANPTPNSGDTFGVVVLPLSTGNIVVTDPGDDSIATDAGAVYLYNGATGALISTLTGTSANDQVGLQGVTALQGNGNYVIATTNWDNGTAIDAGAVTWGSGTTGVSGAVSSSNSLVGSNFQNNEYGAANNFVGNGGITALPNGNYVVLSPNWHSATFVPQSAITWFAPSWGTTTWGATWGDGAKGITGEVFTDNSLIGSKSNYFYDIGISTTVLSNSHYVIVGVQSITWCDSTKPTIGEVSDTNSFFGDFVPKVTPLTNGNYVVSARAINSSPYSTSAIWCDGSTQKTGFFSSTMGLYGEYTGGEVFALANGNYVVINQHWVNGSAINAGAMTWGDGFSGTSGLISAANSIVGTSTGDEIGTNSGIWSAKVLFLLPNGNYILRCSSWDNGTIVDAGAIVFGNGTTGTSGEISALNSLIGSSAGDGLGSGGITVLSNGNYVVSSPGWASSSGLDSGAVTWGDGSIGVVGPINSNNSLIGKWTDNVGSGGITALNNGNYVVNSPAFYGSNSFVGAVTFANGTTGITGEVNLSNSLVGSYSWERIGIGGITPLSNGNYVVSSPHWRINEGISEVGAVTLISGTNGLTGKVSASNSFVGSQYSDHIGSGGVTALPNGNFIIKSPLWSNGSKTDVGAVTFVNGLLELKGFVSESNSLIGTHSYDQIGKGHITTLADSNYIVVSPSWDGVGAITWGSGTNGELLNGTISGSVTPENSIIGQSSVDYSNPWNSTYIVKLSNGGGKILVGLPLGIKSFQFGKYESSSASISPNFVIAPLNTGSATTLQANNDITLSNSLTVNNSGGDGGALTMQAGRSIAINSNLITDNGSLTILANADASTGVIDAQRDSGMGGITLASSAYINAGTGAVSLSTGSATGLTNRSSGGIALNGTLSAGSVAMATAGSGSGSPDVLLNSSVTTTGINGIVIAAAGQVQFGTGGTLTSSNSGASISVTGSAINLRGTIATSNGEIRLSGPVTQTGYFTANSGTGAIHFTNNWTLGSQIASLTTSQAAIVDGTMSMNSGIVIASGGLSIATNGSLTGNGVIIGSLSMGTNATISPGSAGTSTGNGLLNLGSGSLSLASTSIVSLDGSGRSTFDRIIAGGVTLAGATLNLSLASFTLNTGESITLMDNISSSSTIGTFNGLAEGALFTVNGQQLQIKYTGGDGNDVTVTSVANITASFAVSYSAFFYFPPTATSRSVITLRNTSNSNRNPTMLKLLGVPDRVTVVGATKSGSDWIINLNSAIIWPNGSLGVPVSFKINSGGLFNYTTEIIGG